MKKLLLVLVLGIVFVSMCVTEPPAPEPINNVSNYTPGNVTPNGGNLSLVVVEIPGDGIIPRDICEAKGMTGKTLAIHKTGCPACTVAVPRVEKVAMELGKEVENLDVAITDKRVRVLEELALLPYKVPTIIIDCNVLVGVKDESVYRELFEAI